jgi:hypothetical protein
MADQPTQTTTTTPAPEARPNYVDPTSRTQANVDRVYATVGQQHHSADRVVNTETKD